MLHLEIYNRTKTPVAARNFSALLKPAWNILRREKKLRRQKYTIELTFTGDSAIKKLNKYHHNKNRPTDVISLSYYSLRMKDDFAGEIFISVPYARRQARRVHQPLKEELRFLFIHGLLHVFGYDHVRAREEAHMKKLAYGILGRN